MNMSSSPSGFFAAFQVLIGLGGILLLALIALLLVVLIVRRGRALKPSRKGEIKLRVSSLNERYEEHCATLQAAVLGRKEYKAWAKEEDKKDKLAEKNPSVKPRVFVLDFSGDIQASQVESLREQVSAILEVRRAGDEVVVRLESPGGVVHSYGLAASQLERLRARQVPLTVCVDRVAASGGYMMACIANKIYAAPFAVLGSIGVVASMPNVHKLLRKHDVEWLELTAGEHKRTVTPFGEVTEKGKAKFVEQLEDAHALFKAFVSKNRPGLDIPRVATGEHWFGMRALELGLVDELLTSDDYIRSRCEEADVFLVAAEQKETLAARLQKFALVTFPSALAKAAEPNIR